MRKLVGCLSFYCAICWTFSVQAEPVCNCGSTENNGDGTNCCWEYDETTKTLTVSGSGAMQNYGPDEAVGMNKLIYQAERPWNDIALDVEHVIVNGLSSVGHRAFQNMYNVQEVVLSESVETVGRTWRDQIKTVYADGSHGILQWHDNTLIEPTYIPYQKTDNGQYVIHGKFYNTLSDVAHNSRSLKRIYTIEEATLLSKETGNTIKLRYK